MIYEVMWQVVCQYVECVVEKLCGEWQFCRYIVVFVKILLFVVIEFYYGNLVSEKLFIFMQDIWDIIVVVVRVLDRIWVDGYCYVKVGCMLNDFMLIRVLQFNLFDEVQLWEWSEQLM